MKIPEGTGIAIIGSVKIRGRRWKMGVASLRSTGLRGTCLTPKRKGPFPPVVVVSSHLPVGKRMMMEAVLHETLHATHPRMSEAEVATTANTLAKVLHVYGFGRAAPPATPGEG